MDIVNTGVRKFSCIRKKLLSIVCFCLFILMAGCSPDYTASTPWTVELESGDLKVVLKAPFGAFLIHRMADIDRYRFKVKGLSSVEMEYHYESRLPYWVWKNLPENKGKDVYSKVDTSISANISPTQRGADYAVIYKKLYFDEKMLRVSPPVEVGPVWNGKAIKYENFNTSWYVIQERTDLDGLLITCGNSSFYCRLRGARVTERVGIDSMTVPIADVENWRSYQQLIQEKVSASIVSVEVN